MAKYAKTSEKALPKPDYTLCTCSHTLEDHRSLITGWIADCRECDCRAFKQLHDGKKAREAEERNG